MSCRSFAFLLSALLLGGSFVFAQDSSAGTSVQEAPAQPTVSGTIAYRERIALPADAAIEVKVQDVSLQGAPAKTIAETVFAPAGKQVPISFQLAYNPADINRAHAYHVQANITVKGKLMFTTMDAYPVITLGAPSQVTLMLKQAPAETATASGAKLIGVNWVLAEMDNKPPQPGQGQPVHLVFHKKGKVTGSTGCNNVIASYIASEGALQFTLGAVTRKACSAPVMQQEQAVLGALKSTTTYHIEGQTLELGNGDQVLAKFEAEAK